MIVVSVARSQSGLHIPAMVKTKSKAIVSIANGAGGMMEVKDRRFDQSDWPMKFEVPVERDQADRWPRYLTAGCHRRSWASSAFGQMERSENSGSITLSAHGKPQIDITWDRRRDRPMRVRARLAPSSELPWSDAEQFFREINEACASAATDAIYCRGTLQYDGLAWRGELWLDEKTRLAPPSLQDETAIIGPRHLHVDAILACIGQPDVSLARQETLLEVSAFLSVVMKTAVRLPDQGRVWTLTADMKSSEVRHLGYLESANPPTMPSRGTTRPVPLYAADNPPLGIDGSTNELSLRSDIADLWVLYRSLSAERRRQFLQAAAKWQEAMIHWQDRPSLSFTLMVIACEALKPPDTDDRQNCYDVIQALLGAAAVGRIRQNHFPAQRVRSTHLHTGEFHGSEFAKIDFLASYHDPSFRDAHREMARVTPAAIIEWLKRHGILEMPAPRSSRTFRRWVKDNAIPVAAACLGSGLAAGWELRILLSG